MNNITQIAQAKNGIITEEMRRVAEKEYHSPEFIREEVAQGRIVIPANINHKNPALTSLPGHSIEKKTSFASNNVTGKKFDPVGIGKSLFTKVNANIGNSNIASNVNEELDKLRIAIKYGADTVMDLSTGENINEIRKAIIENSAVPIGTVPVYEVVSYFDDPVKLTPQVITDTILRQAEQGVDYMTIHAGLLKRHLPLAMKRKMKIVSRGGAIIASWMQYHNRENPFYTLFDEILEICKTFDVTLSLGDGLRPGCLADASDEAQFAELDILSELVQRCRDNGVQCMVEGPGHIPLHEIQMNMEKEDEICKSAPFYVLGPVVTDCAPGYDHITAAIGGAVGAWFGASMLCYVTPKEHLGLPNIEDVREGVIAFKIAAHAADIARGRPHARDRDDAISDARVEFNWEKQFELAFDGDKARKGYEERFTSDNVTKKENKQNKLCKHKEKSDSDDFCSMCGEKFCSMKISAKLKSGTRPGPQI